ncbi:MAG TPA: 6-carboxytetrahydropterin synthase [Candidatus Dormibacteraeota bacterium]|nr:6-carboxytetrahydropterin synthase [Candidatus Dormibacteraeota bacterium]
MFTVGARFTFSASHILDDLGPEHPCGRLHGHNWTATVYLAAAETDAHGFVVDLLDLAPLRAYIETTLEHRHLNDVLPVSPTSENVARHLHDIARARWPQVVACAVSESDRTCALYAPGDAVLLPG